MTLQQLSYLVTVAECGNITDAAERLFISQPSLSTAIHNLEKEMGVTAFVRSNKGVTVTREGEELLAFARQLLEQADLMQEHFGAGKKREPKFCVSCQHYSFAVNAFVDVVQQFDADGYAIGGLAVGEPAPVMYEMIELVNGILPIDRPRYLMGVGTPVNLLEAIERGVDMFDCVMPTRNGRNGMLFTSEGIINIRNQKWRDDSPIRRTRRLTCAT